MRLSPAGGRRILAASRSMDCPSCRSAVDEAARGCRACGTPLGLGPGSVVAGRFELLKRLGGGGMGNVFEALDRQLHETFALKVVLLGRDPQARKRFHSEVRLARKVKHRNVCGVYDYGEDGEIVYCSMELVRGRNLRELLLQAPLSRERAYEIAVAAAGGLQAIHDAGIIHRDVKAANVMIDEKGEARIVDFGIAKPQAGAAAPGSDVAVTDELHVIGSPEYMSPEQVRGAALDVRSDVYSFGIVLYELFTGRVPFRDPTPFGVMVKQVQEAPRLDGPVADLLPAPLVPVLRRALAKEPRGRYASIGELARELRRARGEQARSSTDELEPPGRGRRWTLFPGFRPPVGHERTAELMTRAAIAGLVLLGAGILAYGPWRSPRELLPPPATTTTTTTATTTVPPATPEIILPLVSRPGKLEHAREGARPPRTPAPRDAVVRPGSGAVTSLTGGEVTPETTVQPSPTTPTTTTTTTSTTTTLKAAPVVVDADCGGQKVVYTGQAEGLGAQGLVVVEFVVEADGRVTRPRIVRAENKDLEDSALRSVSRWRCRPATRDGRPVASRVAQPLDFRLPGR
jgi:serine/threonine-protein kinase